MVGMGTTSSTLSKGRGGVAGRDDEGVTRVSFGRSEDSGGSNNEAVSCGTTSSVWTAGFESSFSWRGDFEIG